MKTARLHRNLLFCSVALALSVPVGALAQQAEAASADPAPAGQESQGDPATLDTVVVTGVRGSMARAIELKRESGTVQDSISALELGKHKITVNAVCPNHVTTGLGAQQNEYFSRLLGFATV